MKNQLTAFVKSLGGDTAYSGKNKRMYITGKRGILTRVKERFPRLPFEIIYQ